MRACRLSFVLLLAAGLGTNAWTGCGDDQGPCTPGEDASTSDAGADAAVPPESVTFIAVTYSAEDQAWVPMEPTMVAFDAPGGERLEGVTGSDGKITFDGVRWSQGKAAVTAFRLRYTVYSAVDLDAARLAEAFRVDDAVAMPMFDITEPAEPATVPVTGSATLIDPTRFYSVYVSGAAGGTTWTGGGDETFSVNAPRNVPFSLLVVEHDFETVPSGYGLNQPTHAVQELPMDAIATPRTVRVDLTHSPMSTSTADCWVDLPARADSPLLRSTPYTTISTFASTNGHGWPTHADYSTDRSRFDVSYLWVTPSYGGSVYTVFYAVHGYELSAVTVDGPPPSGALGTLLDLPRWTTPSDIRDLHLLHAPIEWELFDSDVPTVRLTLTRLGRDYWHIFAGSNATSLTVPALPSAVDPVAVLGEDPLAAYLWVGDMNLETWIWSRVARPLPIELVP